MFNWFKKSVADNAAPATPPAAAADDAAESKAHEARSDAHKARGNALFAEGRLDEAAASFNAAIASHAGNAAAHFNLGLILREQGRLDDAAASFERALQAAPGMADAAHLTGSVRHQQGRLPQAITHYRAALAIATENPAPYADLCLALQQQGQPAEALRVAEAGIALHPQFAELHQLKGNLLAQQGQLANALQSLDRAQALGAADFELHHQRAMALGGLGRVEDALKACDSAIALDPRNAAVHNNRAFALATLRRYDEAVAAYRRALALAPGNPDLLNSMGLVYTSQNKHALALPCFDDALKTDARHVDALSNRAIALGQLRRREESILAFERLVEVAPDLDYALGLLLEAKVLACDWSGREALVQRVAGAIRAGRRAMAPFPWLAVSDDAELQYLCSLTCQQDKFPAAAQPLWRGERHAHDRIRVAYLSADFHNHATAYLMAELFELHDPQRFETIALSYGTERGGEMRQRLERAFSRFVDVSGKSDGEIAQLMREMEVDIAVDLKGYTAEARIGIFAQRAAPVQVTWIGYPGTTAAPYMDYLIADAQVVAPEDERWYSEKIVRMPHSYQVNDTKRRIAPEVPPRQAQGLPDKGFVFCCFNNNYKITPPVFEVWMRLLAQVPGSVLWLLEDSALASGNLRREAAARGVAPERLVFAARAPLDAHLARHALADLFIDTQPYNAHTTASDALWAGLPVLTCMGATFAARVGGSLLQAVGLPELVTHSLQDYEALALRLATRPAELAALREKLAGLRASAPLFDAQRFRRDLESAYIRMWERARHGGAPESFAVEPLVTRPA